MPARELTLAGHPGPEPRVPSRRGKKLADICFTLIVEDTHLVNYSLKKLERLGVVRGVKTGKEVIYSTTDEGAAAIRRYAEVREQCLVKPLHRFARRTRPAISWPTPRALSGHDQAARAATL